MWKQFFLTSLFVLVLFGLSATSAKELQAAAYLPANSVDAEKLIGPPPEVGSVAYREQMAIVLWLQKTRTPAQIAFVTRKLSLERFMPLIGARLLDVDGIELQKTLTVVLAEVQHAYDAVKTEFGEPRPFTASKLVHPIKGTDLRPVPSYPSGHAIRAMVYARLLAKIFPSAQDALLDLAHQISYGRVIAGVHYPADILAGLKLGNAYADVILDQKSFQNAVRRIEREPTISK